MVTIEGNPWFLAVDALRSMGFDIGYGGTSNHLLKLDAAEKMSILTNLLRGKGMNQAKLISESGLYKLALRSDLDSAKPFQDWVTKAVLSRSARMALTSWVKKEGAGEGASCF